MELFTISEAAKMLHVGDGTIRNAVTNGHITFYKVGKRVRFSNAHITEYLERGLQQAAPKTSKVMEGLKEIKHEHSTRQKLVGGQVKFKRNNVQIISKCN